MYCFIIMFYFRLHCLRTNVGSATEGLVADLSPVLGAGKSCLELLNSLSWEGGVGMFRRDAERLILGRIFARLMMA